MQDLLFKDVSRFTKYKRIRLHLSCFAYTIWVQLPT